PGVLHIAFVTLGGKTAGAGGTQRQQLAIVPIREAGCVLRVPAEQGGNRILGGRIETRIYRVPTRLCQVLIDRIHDQVRLVKRRIGYGVIPSAAIAVPQVADQDNVAAKLDRVAALHPGEVVHEVVYRSDSAVVINGV